MAHKEGLRLGLALELRFELAERRLHTIIFYFFYFFGAQRPLELSAYSQRARPSCFGVAWRGVAWHVAWLGVNGVRVWAQHGRACAWTCAYRSVREQA